MPETHQVQNVNLTVTSMDIYLYAERRSLEVLCILADPVPNYYQHFTTKQSGIKVSMCAHTELMSLHIVTCIIVVSR